MAISKNPTTNLSGSNYVVVMLLITLLVLGLTTLIGKALISSVRLNTKVVAKKSTAITQLNSDVANAPALVSAYQGLGDPGTAGTTSKTLNDALPTSADFPDLIAALENMADTSSLSLKSVVPDSSGIIPTAPVSSNTFAAATTPYEVNVTVEGSYASLQKFLMDIENSARPMHVSTSQISGTGSDVTANLTLETYYQDAATLPFKTETVK